MTELCDLSAVELRRGIGAGQVSPVALLESCRRRIEAVNPAINAFVALDWDRAQAAAVAAEQAVTAGATLGPLHGLPIGIKDLVATAGLRTTYGSLKYKDHVPEVDARQITDLRAAGGIILGKTNTPDHGAGANTRNAVYGATGNPFDPTKTAAGSSGGSGAALATGMVPLATGSDMGGSLRNPAAFNGVVGFRPTPGTVPRESAGLGYSPLSVEGPMGRDVADCALLHRGMVATDYRDPLTVPGAEAFAGLRPVDLGTLRVAISEDLGFAPIDDGIRAAFRTAMAKVRGRFGRAEDADPPLGEECNEAFEITRAVSFLAGHLDTYRSAPELLSPNIVANVEQGLRMTAADAARGLALHTQIYRRFLAWMRDWDVLICPAMSVSPFPHDQWYPTHINGQELRTYFHWLAPAYGLTLTSHPVVCIPCGRDPAGMPLGIQICGKRGDDAGALSIAAAVERALADIPGLERPVPDLAALQGAVAAA